MKSSLEWLLLIGGAILTVIAIQRWYEGRTLASTGERPYQGIYYDAEGIPHYTAYAGQV